MTAASRTLVTASGVLLRSEPASEHSTLLVEVRPGLRPKTWRAVPNEDVHKHVCTWASEHGIEFSAPPSGALPCPRCQETCHLRLLTDDLAPFLVCCWDCSAAPNGIGGTEAEAIEDWNKKARP